MSRWTTLNIDGASPRQLSDAFDEWWAYQHDGVTIVYSFNPNMSPKEAAAEAVKAGGSGPDPVVESVLSLKCDDTSDFVAATIYRPKEVKWTGVRAERTWSGHHSFAKGESEFLDRMPRGQQPLFGGNWKGDMLDNPDAKTVFEFREKSVEEEQ